MAEVIDIQAPAKVNLALAVGEPDATGMHPICSWMTTIGLFDDLTVKRLERDRFSLYAILWHSDARRKSEVDWPIAQDLAVRAHLALEAHCGRKLPVQLKLEKRIPVGGGLGGGSADAAAMLHAVNHVHELGLSLDELETVAARLGSDVVFLVRGGSAIVEGCGEQVSHHTVHSELPLVVVLPESPCATKAVYRRFDEIDTGPLRADAVHALAPLDASSGAIPRPDALFNDLTRAAIRVAPGLDDQLAAITRLAERPAHLTGSGSAMFVLCDDPVHGEFLAQAIEDRLELPAIATTTVAGVGAAVAERNALSRPGA